MCKARAITVENIFLRLKGNQIFFTFKATDEKQN